MHGAKSHDGRVDSILLLAELYNKRLDPSELGAAKDLLEAAMIEIFPSACASGQGMVDQRASRWRYGDLVALPPTPDAHFQGRLVAITFAAC